MNTKISGYEKNNLVPIQIIFDVLGLLEVPSVKRGKMFEVKRVITISDIMEYAKDKNLDIWKLDVGAELLTQMKMEKVLEDVETLKSNIISIFSDEFSLYSDDEKSKVVQFVYIPITFEDFAPGSMAIRYRVMTERSLGIIENE